MNTNVTFKNDNSSQVIDLSIWQTVCCGGLACKAQLIEKLESFMRNHRVPMTMKEANNFSVHEKNGHCETIKLLSEVEIELVAEEMPLDLVLIKPEDLGLEPFSSNGRGWQMFVREEVFKKGIEIGLELCPPEIPFVLSLLPGYWNYQGRHPGYPKHVATKPYIKPGDEKNHHFIKVKNCPGVTSLEHESCYQGFKDPSGHFYNYDEVIFVKPRK